MSGDLWIGTSGWHYPAKAGGWNGVFYPAPRPKGFDELAFYAESFDFVELNTTFYGQPRAEIAAQWATRTPSGFLFSVKLYQQFTHPTMFRRRVEATLTRTLGTTELPESAIAALIEANAEDLDAFKRGIDPLATAGKLGPLLAQFPASFRDSADSRTHLASLMRAFHGYPLAIELRHKSWSDRVEETRKLIEAFGAAWAWIDEPKFKDSVQQPTIDAVPFAYVRLHGRNAKSWWHHSHRDERYNYEYSAEELEPIAAQLEEVGKRGHRRFAVLNNHYDGRAIKNARMLKARLEQDIRMPAETVSTKR